MPIQLSGSLVITGSITTTGVIIMSGSIASASYSSNSDLLQGTGSTGFATTASINEVSASQQSISASLLQVSASYTALSGSYNVFSGSASTRITENSSSIQQVSASQQQISSSLLQVSASYISLSGSYNTFSGSASTRTTQIEQVYATTGSNSFRANQSITGSLVVSSTITAQTLVVQTVTSSIVYSSGSNLFGSALGDRQTFTGSVNITGSLALAGNITGNAVTLTGALGGTSATFSSSVTATSDSTLFKEGFRINATTTGGGGSQPAYTYYTAAGSKRWSTFLNVGDDKFHIANASNSELFTITQGGNVGIGTITPLSALDVRAANATMGNYQTIQAFSTDSAAINLGGGISLGGYYTSTTSIAQFASIVGRKENGTSGNYDGYLAFGTNAQATGVVERMRITSGGLVNILSDSTNTTFTNSGTLAIKNAASEPFMSWHSNTGTRLGFIQMQSAGTAYFSVQVAQALAFDTSGTERMRITACGTVKTQCNEALGALQTSGTIANNNCVFLNLNSAGGNGSIGFIAIGAARTDTTACQAVRLYSHSHTNGYNTYTSIQGINDGGITISDCVASGAQYIYNCSGATANYVVRYINLISLNSIFERQ